MLTIYLWMAQPLVSFQKLTLIIVLHFTRVQIVVIYTMFTINRIVNADLEIMRKIMIVTELVYLHN